MKAEVQCPLASSGNLSNTSDKRKSKIQVNFVLYFVIEISFLSYPGSLGALKALCREFSRLSLVNHTNDPEVKNTHKFFS